MGGSRSPFKGKSPVCGKLGKNAAGGLIKIRAVSLVDVIDVASEGGGKTENMAMDIVEITMPPALNREPAAINSLFPHKIQKIGVKCPIVSPS